MMNAQSKFKFKDLCLLAIFRTSPTGQGPILIKVGNTSAINFHVSGEHGTDKLTYVYPMNEEKVRLKRETLVYPIEKRLLLSLDFNTEDEMVDAKPNPFKEIPSKGAKSTRIKTAVRPRGGNLVGAGLTETECKTLGIEKYKGQKKPVVIPLYESGGGLAWSGRGPRPAWLAGELERGEKLIDYLNPKHPEYAAYKAKLSK